MRTNLRYYRTLLLRLLRRIKRKGISFICLTFLNHKIMKGFINLTLRTERTSIAVNPDHIVAIQDLRTDPATKDKPEWQYSVIMTKSNRFYVKETLEEICNLISELL